MSRSIEAPVRLPRWPHGCADVGLRLLRNLHATLRPRPMGARRTVRNPGGEEIKEELDLSLEIDAAVFDRFCRVLDAHIRSDSALWAGFDSTGGLDEDLDVPRVFSWPDWITLSITARL